MRNAVLGSIIGLGLLVALWSAKPSESQAQQRFPSGDRGGLVADGLQVVSSETIEGRQQVVLMEPRTKVLAVYQIDRATGSITLKSVRSIEFDLLIKDFGSSKPKPSEIESLLKEQN